MPQPVDVVGLLEAGVKAEEVRQRTIASNIANLETPGYRRLDVRFEELLAKALRSPVRANHGASLQDVEPEVFQPLATPIKSNGNDVNMEMEIGEMLKNASRQTAFLRLLRKKFAQIENAITIRE